MVCSKCGKELSQGSCFCSNCGNKIDINSNTNNFNNVDTNNLNNSFNNMYNYSIDGNNNLNNKSNNKNLLIILFSVILFLIVVISIIVFSNNKGKDSEEIKIDNKVESRTVLIYLCGSDLESRLALGSFDLDSIVQSNVDTDKINVVVYTGGAKTWHNYINNRENAIYVLEDDKFVKKETYSIASMGSSSSFSKLLDYGYRNYKADKYDLVMWNHGLGSLGISSDELYSSDYLSLDELTSALKKSNFTDKNKFETVVFRSCLNSTLEMASVFVPYAKYFVASEEVTWGGYGYGIFGFLGDIKLDDTGIDFGKKYIDSYNKSIEYIAEKRGGTVEEVLGVSTYSIVDLSKLNNVKNKLNSFVKDINLDLDYNNIARARSNLYQYASEAGCNDYDTVDLYSLITELKFVSNKTSEVLTAIEEAVVYNSSNNDFSKGLAVYFPYKSSSGVRKIHYSGYKNLSGLGDYYSFIKEFDNIQSLAYNNNGFSTVSKSDIKVSVQDSKVLLNINNDDIDNYAKASYIIFEKNSDGTFMPVLTSDTFELSKNNYSLNLNDSLIKVINKDTNASQLLTLYKNNLGNYYTNADIYNKDETLNSSIYFILKNDVKISKVIIRSENESKGIILNIDDYFKIKFLNNNYNILKDNKVNDEWEKSLIDNSFEVRNYEFEKVTLDSNYYVMFKIYDVDNLYSFSELVQLK